MVMLTLHSVKQETWTRDIDIDYMHLAPMVIPRWDTFYVYVWTDSETFMGNRAGWNIPDFSFKELSDLLSPRHVLLISDKGIKRPKINTVT